MFKKVMSVPDELIERYYELLSRISLGELQDLREGLSNKTRDPRDAKKALAMELVTRYQGSEAARKARDEYETIIERKAAGSMEAALPVLTVSAASGPKSTWLPQVMKDTGLAKGTGEAIRLIKQGGVKVDDNVVADPETKLTPGADYIIKVGKKKFYKVVVI
jgi:tyrosyl-tRNA synthetase